MQKLFRNYIFDFIACFVSAALGVLMLPVFDIGTRITHFIFAVFLMLYMMTYLADRIRRRRGYAFITACTEFAVLAVLVVLLVLGQFNVFSALTVCGALGLVLWIHGVLSLVSVYLYSAAKRTKYSFILFLVFIGITSLGVYLFARPIINDTAISIMICAAFFAVAVVFLILGIFFSPAKSKKAKGQKTAIEKKSRS